MSNQNKNSKPASAPQPTIVRPRPNPGKLDQKSEKDGGGRIKR